jgi:hypothetical protein
MGRGCLTIVIVILMVLALVLIAAGCESAQAQGLEARFEVLKGVNSLQDLGGALTLGVPARSNLTLDVGAVHTAEGTMQVYTGISAPTPYAGLVTMGLADRAGIGYVWRDREIRLILARGF